MLQRLGITELLILLAILLLLFGAKRIPDIAESLGKAVRKLRKAQEESDSDHHDQPR